MNKKCNLIATIILCTHTWMGGYISDTRYKYKHHDTSFFLNLNDPNTVHGGSKTAFLYRAQLSVT